MTEEQILVAACAYVDCMPDQILAHHIYEDRIVLVVDRGIAGGPKYTVVLADLVEQEPEPPKLTFRIISATPSARRLAEKAGLDLAVIAGSGIGGKILKKDVEKYHD